jgi:hypothetical protein
MMVTTNQIDLLPHVIASIDPGASSIKVAYSLIGADICCPMTIEPYCYQIDDVPPARADFDVNSVWVGVGGLNYAVGNYAVTEFDCPLEVKPLKIETIVPKICAALAVLHHKLNLPPRFNLSLVSVLPPGEYGYKDEMIRQLRLAMRKIITPAGIIRPIVQAIEVYPEGFGVMDWHRTEGIARDRDIGVVMMGFRNTSVLFSRGGEITKPKSSDYGLYKALERISSTSGGYPESELVFPVWEYMTKDDSSPFKSICRSTDFEKEIQVLTEATRKAMAIYRRNLESWLKGAMQRTDVIVLCGGNADYIGDDIVPFLRTYVKEDPVLGYSILRHIDAASIPLEIIETKAPHRFLDIYCLWQRFNSNYKI